MTRFFMVVIDLDLYAGIDGIDTSEMIRGFAIPVWYE
jgi:hypothetical protein